MRTKYTKQSEQSSYFNNLFYKFSIQVMNFPPIHSIKVAADNSPYEILGLESSTITLP